MSNLLFLDIEGTGLDTANDRIIELCLYPAGGEPRTRRFNPGIPIPPESTAVHGITDEDVKNEPKFSQVAASVQEIVTGSVLVGYSLRRYDSLILDAELRRAGQAGLPRDEAGRICIPELDLYELWQRHEPRTLVGASARFAGVDLQDAHSAGADTEVLPDVLNGIITAFGLGQLSTEDLCALCVPDGEVDRDGKFKRREDGVIVFNFGQSRGQNVLDNPGLLRWIIGKDFSMETKNYAIRFLEDSYNAEDDAA